jgi:hypothetical protein
MFLLELFEGDEKQSTVNSDCTWCEGCNGCQGCHGCDGSGSW